MAKLLLAGFDRETGSEISRKLTQLGHQCECQSLNIEPATSREADVVFVSGDDVRWTRLLERVRAEQAAKPVVVISRVAEDTQWVYALEAGATDYCASTIDLANLSWIVKNVLVRRAHAFAAA